MNEVRCEPGQFGTPAVADGRILILPADLPSFVKDRDGFRWRGRATLVCNLDPSHTVELSPIIWMPTGIVAGIPPIGPCDEDSIQDELHQPENARWRFLLELKIPQAGPEATDRSIESGDVDVQGYEGTGYRPFNWPPGKRW